MKTEPDFEIDKKGRVICRLHSSYFHFIAPNKDYFEDLYLDVEITCKTCVHYKNDDCIFSKSKIDEIDFNRINKKMFKCKFCGNQIHRMQTVMYKLYNKEAFSVDIPITCCNCYDNIFEGEFLRNSKKRISVDILTLLFLIFTLFSFIILIGSLSLMPFYFISWMIPWVIITFNDLTKLKRNIFGVKNYKKYFPKFEEISEIFEEVE